MPQRRNYPFYQIDLMCALALAIDLFDADCYEYKGLEKEMVVTGPSKKWFIPHVAVSAYPIR